jgi:uncharacterized protein YggU (UPF0235/DUF167 family)
VVGVLAEVLGVSRAAVRIVAGERSPRKVVDVEGAEAEIFAKLGKSQLPNPKSQ